MSGTIDQQIAIYCGAKYPRKLKKKLYGTRRSRRRFDLEVIRALTRKPKLVVHITMAVDTL